MQLPRRRPHARQRSTIVFFIVNGCLVDVQVDAYPRSVHAEAVWRTVRSFVWTGRTGLFRMRTVCVWRWSGRFVIQAQVRVRHAGGEESAQACDKE